MDAETGGAEKGGVETGGAETGGAEIELLRSTSLPIIHNSSLHFTQFIYLR